MMTFHLKHNEVQSAYSAYIVHVYMLRKQNRSPIHLQSTMPEQVLCLSHYDVRYIPCPVLYTTEWCDVYIHRTPLKLFT